MIAASAALASAIGSMLRQEYLRFNGAWWLVTLGQFQRELTAEEVEWHVARRHLPFVEGGVAPNDPRWWDDPE